MKFVVALLLGAASVQAVSRKHQHRQKHADSTQLHAKLDKLDAELRSLHSEFDKLAKEADLLEGQPISAVQKTHHHKKNKHHHKNKKFATGMAWGDKLGQTIRIKDTGKGGRLLPVKLNQAGQSLSQFDLAGPKGPGLPDQPAGNAPLAQPRGEKEWQQWAQDTVDWADKQTDKAQKRLPYASTLVSTGFDLAGAKGPGLPDAPAGNKETNPARGEKEWQQWAQDQVDWEDKQTDAANKRIPYASTLLGTGFDLAGPKGPGLPDLPAGNKETSNPRGEKEWQTWAQDFVDWEDKQTDAANKRIPYASTLLQTESEFDLAGTKGPGLPDAPAGNKPLATARGEKEWQGWAQDFVDWEDKQTDVANKRIPYASTLLQTEAEFNLAGPKGPGLPDLPAGNAPTAPARGEKEWQDWAQDFVDWEDKQTDIANKRIPYASTLLQTGDDLDNIETMEQRLPVSTELMQTGYEIAGQKDAEIIDNILMNDGNDTPQNDASRIETMAIEEVPLDQRLIFIQNDMGDQAVRIA